MLIPPHKCDHISTNVHIVYNVQNLLVKWLFIDFMKYDMNVLGYSEENSYMITNITKSKIFFIYYNKNYVDGYHYDLHTY